MFGTNFEVTKITANFAAKKKFQGDATFCKKPRKRK